jgi:tight adherence protein C
MDIVAAAATSLAVFVLVLALVRPGRGARALEQRFGNLERGAPLEREDLLALPFGERVATPLARRLARVGSLVFPARVVAALDRRLMLAGRPATVSGFLTLQSILAASGLLLVFMALTTAKSGVMLAAWLGSGVLVALVPIYWLRIKVAARRTAILRALPDAIDLMVTTVEAGMGIDGALHEVGNDTPGPLGEELRQTVRETTLGRSRRDAMQRLVDRTETPELKSFIQSLMQAEQTGIPIGQVLRVQADQMRLRRRQAAESAAQRAPVKMILVLITLVLPAMLMFVMGPAMMRMRDVI